MSWKNTWSLIAIACLLFGFIMLFERHLPVAGAKPVQERLVLESFSPSAVTGVEFTAGTNSVRVERSGSAWRVTAPVSYPAQNVRIQHLLDGCSKLKSQVVIGTREIANQARGLADYGLTPPQASIRALEGDRSTELLVGNKAPVGERYYVQVAGRNEVFIVDAAFLELLPRSLDDWRDDSLLGLRGQTFNRIEVRSGTRGFELMKDTNNVWRITKPMSARADNPIINRLAEELPTWPVRAFITDDPKANLEPFGLQTPPLELLIGQGTNDISVIQFGAAFTNSPNFVFARRMNHTNVVLTPIDWLEPLRQPFTVFRDRRVLSFEPIKVTQLELKGEESLTLVRGTNGLWSAPGQTNFVADTDLVHHLVNNLAELEVIGPEGYVKDVVTEFASYGLAPAKQQYVLYSTQVVSNALTNVVIAQLDLGNAQPASVFARRPDEDSVYAVPVSDVRRLPKALYELRDRRLWKFVSTNVAKVSIQQAGLSRQFTRNSYYGTLVESAPPSPLVPLTTEVTLDYLGSLRAERWVARGEDKLSVYGMGLDALQITLEVNTGDRLQTLTLRLGKTAPSLNQYGAVIIDGVPVIFELARDLYQFILRDLTASPPQQ